MVWALGESADSTSSILTPRSVPRAGTRATTTWLRSPSAGSCAVLRVGHAHPEVPEAGAARADDGELLGGQDGDAREGVVDDAGPVRVIQSTPERPRAGDLA